MTLDSRDAVFTLPVGDPRDALLGRRVRAATEHRHLVGDDESRIEPDAELADELGILALIARETLEKLARAGAGDRA